MSTPNEPGPGSPTDGVQAAGATVARNTTVAPTRAEATKALQEALRELEASLDDQESWLKAGIKLVRAYCDEIPTGHQPPQETLHALIAACWKMRSSPKAEKLCKSLVYLYQACSPQSDDTRPASELLGLLNNISAALAKICNELEATCALICSGIDAPYQTTIRNANKRITDLVQKAQSALRPPCSQLENSETIALKNAYRELACDYRTASCEYDSIAPLVQPLVSMAVRAHMHEWADNVNRFGAAVSKPSARKDNVNEPVQEFQNLRELADLVSHRLSAHESNCGQSVRHLREVVNRLKAHLDEAIALSREHGGRKGANRDAVGRLKKLFGDIRAGFEELGRCGGDELGLPELLEPVATSLVMISVVAPFHGETPAAEREDELELTFEGFPEDAKLSVEVFDTEGKLLSSHPVDNSATFRYSAERARELDVVGLADGVLIEKVRMKV